MNNVWKEHWLEKRIQLSYHYIIWQELWHCKGSFSLTLQNEIIKICSQPSWVWPRFSNPKTGHMQLGVDLTVHCTLETPNPKKDSSPPERWTPCQALPVCMAVFMAPCEVGKDRIRSSTRVRCRSEARSFFSFSFRGSAWTLDIIPKLNDYIFVCWPLFYIVHVVVLKN